MKGCFMNIRRLRKAIGITQEELSARIGVHEKTIRLWEKECVSLVHQI